VSVDNLQVQYGTLESAAAKADATAEAFLDQLSQLESQVKAMVWQGGSGTAFQGYFDMVKGQLRPVQDTLHGLATQVRGASTKLQDSDQAVAQAFRQG
jgi:WXG100 family type VII secretion target